VGCGVATPLPALVVVLVVVAGVVLDFEVVEAAVAVVEGLVATSVLGVVLEVGVVVGGSSLMVPMTQYELFVSRLGQLIPGFNILRSSTATPQLLEKLSHVAPLSAEVEKSQSTPRRT
jgi:uncharacterized membrane protein YqhA